MNYARSSDPLPGSSGTGSSSVPVSVTATSDVAGTQSLWRAFETTAVGHVFQTYDFVAAWVAHVAAARGIEPRIVIGRADDDRILFLLPLGVRRSLGLSVIEWLGAEHADYHGGLFDAACLQRLAGDKTAFDAFLDAVTGAIGGTDLLHFIRMPADLDGIRNPFLHLDTHPNANGAHATVLQPDWDTYYRAKRQSGWRRTERKKDRELAAHGDVSLVVAETPEQVEQILSALFRQKRQGLAKTGVADIFAPAGVRDFYRQLALNSLGGRGPVQLSALYCGDAIAAVSYGLIRRDTYYYVLHSYDLDALAGYSPGSQLMRRLMQWCFDNDLRVFDFTIGDESYKDIWCETELALVNAEVPLTPLGSAAAGAIRIREGAKRKIKNEPALWAAAVGMRRALRKLRP